MDFVIPVAPRTKKNSQSFVTLKTGRTILLPSKTYREFEKKVVGWTHATYGNLEPISNPINLCCKFYMDKRYKSDLVGYLQAIQDALVKAKFIEDDNHHIVASVDGSEVLYDKNNPRIEVSITPRKEPTPKDNIVKFPLVDESHQITIMEAIDKKKGENDA